MRFIRPPARYHQFRDKSRDLSIYDVMKYRIQISISKRVIKERSSEPGKLDWKVVRGKKGYLRVCLLEFVVGRKG